MKTQYALKILGLVLCLIGAFLIFDGGILGERTTGLANLAEIVGIGLIGSSAQKIRGR